MNLANLRTVSLILSSLGLACHCLHAQPQPKHGLHYDTPAMVWDEAMPLANGLLGALVWGDGKPLKISLDRTDLWDLRPVPQFQGQDYSYKKMRQWVKEGRIEDLHRLYDDPYGNPGPTKIPAGRIELTIGGGAFRSASLDLADALATVHLEDNVRAQVFVHATQPVGVIQIETAETVDVKLLAPPFAGEVTDEAGPGKISAGDLASLRYDAPVERAGDNWMGYLQEGWGRSSVHVPNEVIERQWYLEMYKFGAAARADTPPITLQGPWTADNMKIPPWKGDYCNGDQSGKGYSNFRYRPFTLEGNFAAAAGLQEMLLQSYSGTIRVFPAIPPKWKDVSFKTLRAEGAFLVTAVRSAGITERVEILAEKGGLCRIENPFGTSDFGTVGVDATDLTRDNGDVVIATRPMQKFELIR